MHTFTLTWRKSGGNYVTRWSWRPPNLGSYYLHWVCDIGGDIPEFFRNFSVIDNSYAVMIVNNTSLPDIDPVLHQIHMPYSYWENATLYSQRYNAAMFVGESWESREYGDDPGLLIWLSGNYDPDDEKPSQ